MRTPWTAAPTAPSGFFDNAYVCEGRVTAVQPDRRVTDALPGGQTLEAVCTPVAVVVERAYLGDAAVGSHVTVRSMGGTADGLRYLAGEAPPKDVFAPGTRLVVFVVDPGTARISRYSWRGVAPEGPARGSPRR